MNSDMEGDPRVTYQICVLMINTIKTITSVKQQNGAKFQSKIQEMQKNIKIHNNINVNRLVNYKTRWQGIWEWGVKEVWLRSQQQRGNYS